MCTCRYESHLFLTFRGREVLVWNFRGEQLTQFDDHTLWHPDTNTNNIYITSTQDYIVSYCRRSDTDSGAGGGVHVSSILTGINFIVTTHKMRAPGLTWFRLPLFVWAQYATSLIMVLATPVLSITLVLLGVERAFGIGIFDPALGGDPILFEHLFWFYSHPAVYIMLLPAMGVVSEVIVVFCVSVTLIIFLIPFQIGAAPHKEPLRRRAPLPLPLAPPSAPA